MGNCGTCISNDKMILRSKTSRFDIEPADTESLKKQELPILDFYVLISDVKIKKCNIVRLE
jgi:methyl coenzyme M reductase subunit C